MGISVSKVRKIAALINEAGKLASQSGITIFGGSGTGTLRKPRGAEDRLFILADLEGNFDGGDGACFRDTEGFLRGE